jgi:antitoxin component YwqK of YwqJK toxin-antitoxin module
MTHARKNILLVLVLLLTACGSSEGEKDGATTADTTAAPTTATAPTILSDTTLIGNVTDGPVDVRYPDGRSRIKGNMRNGKRHGMWTSFFPDGRPQSFTGYVDGVEHGTKVVYHPSGATYYTGDYVKGQQVGIWRFFDEQGKPSRTITYDSTGTVINDRR